MMETHSVLAADIIISTRNRAELIGPALNSIRNCDGVALTIWVIDQSDNEATGEVVAVHAATDRRVRYVHTGSRGISVARNIGAMAGASPYILFTDDDCLVDPGWAAAMVAALADERTWAVFGRILGDFSDEPVEERVTLGLTLATKTSQHEAIYKGNRFDLSFGHGASMGLRREIWERLGGFDQALGVGGLLRSWEDRDFGYRILAAGGQIAYAPAALVYHRQWRGYKAVLRAYRNYAIGAGATASKYLRYGDAGGFVLLFEWMFNQGLRQIISGMFKWRSWQKISIGLEQLALPWWGLIMGLRYPLHRQHRVYQVPAASHSDAAAGPTEAPVEASGPTRMPGAETREAG
jgi:GT2 family glycosyltransferase